MFHTGGTFAVGGTFAFYAPFASTLVWILLTSVVLSDKLGKQAPPQSARRRASDLWLVPRGIDRRRNHPTGSKRADDQAER